MDFLIADTAVYGKRQREREPELNRELNVAAAIIGSAVIGGAMSASAAGDAADAQSQAASDSNALQKYIFDEQTKLQQPWREAGTAGLNQLSYMMGLSPTAGGSGMPTMETPEQIRARLTQKFTSQNTTYAPGGYLSAEEGGGTTPGAPITNTVIDEAGLARAIAAQQSRQQAQYDRAMGQAERAAERDPNYGSLLDTFDMKDFKADPGYRFRMQEGLKALERSAAARGGLLSGRAAKDTMRFSQGLGAQEYGAAFDRFNVGQTNQFNRLASISGIGQTSANQTGAALANYGNNVSNNIIGAGNAQAAGTVGQANAWNNAIGQGFSMYQQNQLMNRGSWQPYSGPSSAGSYQPEGGDYGQYL